MRQMVLSKQKQLPAVNRTKYAGLNWGNTPAWLPGDPLGHRQLVGVGDLPLENGQLLNNAYLAYETWGQLNNAADNAVLILHALTGDSHLCGAPGPGHPTAGWWECMVGPGRPIDTERFFVVAPNVLGGCQGSTGPAWPHPDGNPWGSRFPLLSTRDQVRAEQRLAEHLGIKTWRYIVGPSAGGFRALEWACDVPDQVENLIIIASAAATTADQAAWSHTQLRAIDLDPYFRGGDYFLAPESQYPVSGLELARQIAHSTYRSAQELNQRFGRYPQHEENPLAGGRYAIQSYLDHHGAKLAKRFDPGSYRVLSNALITHDIGRDRGGVKAALECISARSLVVGVDSDRLFPAENCQQLAAQIPQASYLQIHSPCGHDGFLVESQQLEQAISDFVATS